MNVEDGEVAPPPRRRRFAWILPALVALGLLALFLRRGGDGSAILAALRDAAGRPGWLAVGVALFAVSLACGLLRWFALLRALRLPVPFLDALRLYATGHCFNVLGPGATGGDLVKAAWIALRCPGRRAEAVASIAAERVIGLLALVAILAGATWVRPDFFESSDALLALCRLVRWLALGVAAATLLLAIAPVDALAARLRARGGGTAARIAEAALRAWGAVRLCLRHPFAATAAFALSLANFGTVILCWLSLSRAIGAGIALRDMAVVSPLADGIAALPLTPGGAGLRENTLQWLLDSLGVPRAQSTALGLLMFATILLWAVVCAGIMLAGRRGGARGRSPAGS